MGAYFCFNYFFMRNLLLIAIGTICFASCGNNNQNTAKTFCDTTCNNDDLRFYSSNARLRQSLIISMKDCRPDSMAWTYQGAASRIKAPLSDYVSQDVRIN